MGDFPQRLQKILEENKISKYKLAKEIHISAATLLNYTRGNTKPDITKINLICDRLGINPDWLLHGQGDVYQTNEKNVGYGKPGLVSDTETINKLLELIDQQAASLKEMSNLLKKKVRKNK